MKIIQENHSVWYEKYKPQCIDDIIIPKAISDKFKNYTETQDIPALGLFSSLPGTGKSSTANAIIKELGGEALWINASEQRSIDILRSRIRTFASQTSFDDNIKVVVMDEFDNFSKDGMAAFRSFLDEYSHNCRFIFTGNYKEKIIEPLLDRMEVYDFESFAKEEMIKPIFERLCFILENENVEYNKKDLVPIINTYYPRIRSMVGALQKFSKDGALTVDASDLDDLNIFDKIMELVTPSTYTEMIQAVNNLNAPDNMYSFLYKNAMTYFPAEKYPNMVIVVAKYQHMAGTVRDKQLNLAACLTELLKLRG